jgi:hypothetical protein
MLQQLQVIRSKNQAKPYYIKDTKTGKIISNFASLENCKARCLKLQGFGFPVIYGSTLTMEEALERSRYERERYPVGSLNC